MQVALTALHRACQSSVFRHKDNAFIGLKARDALQSRSTFCTRYALLTVVASVALGTCAAEGAGASPAALAAPSQDEGVRPFDVAPWPATQIGTADPLETITPVGPAEALT